VEYLDAVRDRIIPVLQDRPLSVIRVHRGQEAFMQKNVPKYTPEWVPTVQVWAEASKREVSYALCNDRRTLLWFANQRAIEYHPTLVRHEHADHTTSRADLDPPDVEAFGMRSCRLVRQSLADVGLEGGQTSGAKNYVFVPMTSGRPSRTQPRREPSRRAGARSPDRTTAFIKEDRGGKVFTIRRGVGVPSSPRSRLRPGVPVFPHRLGRSRSWHPPTSRSTLR
jgi:DNA primase